MDKITREQVEKVWRGKWLYDQTLATSNLDIVKCPRCGNEQFAFWQYNLEINFCPVCGLAMTDKGVDIVMQRLEALQDADD